MILRLIKLNGTNVPRKKRKQNLLEMIGLSAVQSFAWILIHNATLSIKASTMLGTRKVVG